ncbi:oxamate carbamoyltransferase subunit AllH family protein [Thalassiella azotivora]
MPSAPTVPVAASTALGELLDGPLQALTVVVAGRLASYAAAGDGRVVAVVAPDALAPPCALVLPAGARPQALLPTGARVLVGRRPGHVGAPALQVVGGPELAVRRWWPADDVTSTGRSGPSPSWGDRGDRSRRDRLRVLLALSGRADPASARARQAAPDAARAVASGDAAGAAQVLAGVLGLGPGLTPSGDDVAAGVLLVARAAAALGRAPSPVVDDLADRVVHAAAARTTVVSCALLAEAARGRAARPVVAAVRTLVHPTGRAVADDGAPDPNGTFERLLAVGHHSGADLATGALATADALADHRPHTSRRSA